MLDTAAEMDRSGTRSHEHCSDTRAVNGTSRNFTVPGEGPYSEKVL